MLTYKRILVLITITSVTMGGFVFLKTPKDYADKNNKQVESLISISQPTGALNIKEERELWGKEIDKLGADIAYKKFIDTYKNKHFGIQHNAMHLFGELLYEKMGLNGLIICDPTFAFGCYHSFFGGALVEHGIDVISRLDELCIEKFGVLGTGCQHGIGHGLMEYYGSSNLERALEACKLTNQVKDLFGCTSGVFMEYNVPLIASENVPAGPRRLNPNNPHEPCNSLQNRRFVKSCYYEMAQWWDKVFNMDYEKIGSLCQEVKGREERESCFLGIGNIAAPSSEYNVEETIKKCALMPSRESELLCRSGASWSFFAEPKARHAAPSICDDLNETQKKQCAQKSDLIGNGEIHKK